MRRAVGLDLGVAVAASFAIGATLLAEPHLREWFARYFGPIWPPLCIAGLGVIALFGAPLLKRHGWWGAPQFRAVLVGSLIVVGFVALITAMDLLFGFPPDLNAPLPWSLLYYPAMGFAAQVALHLAPLIAILWLAPGFARARPWTTMAAASAPEAALQVWGGDSAMAVLVAVHLLGFGIAELYLLRRFGFLAMYAFRLTYYLWWHILWAAWRAN